MALKETTMWYTRPHTGKPVWGEEDGGAQHAFRHTRPCPFWSLFLLMAGPEQALRLTMLWLSNKGPVPGFSAVHGQSLAG